MKADMRAAPEETEILMLLTEKEARAIVSERADAAKVLDLLPIVAPFHKKWVAKLRAEGLDHLVC